MAITGHGSIKEDQSSRTKGAGQECYKKVTGSKLEQFPKLLFFSLFTITYKGDGDSWGVVFVLFFNDL